MIGQLCSFSTDPWFTIDPPFDIIVYVVNYQNGKYGCLMVDAESDQYNVTKHIVVDIEPRYLKLSY